MRLHRDRLGWSQGELSRKLLEAGWTIFHQTTVSRIESGERPIKLGEARAIAAILEVPLSKMLAVVEDSRVEVDLAKSSRDVLAAFMHCCTHISDLISAREALETMVRSAAVQTVAGRSQEAAQVLRMAADYLEEATPEIALEAGRKQAARAANAVSADDVVTWEASVE
jgi:transcriptional regulator with XRE-family HTH domain